MHVHTGKAKAWAFFQRLCTLNKADVYQYSVMLNACNDSFAAETLIGRMEAAGVQPSEVTYQKLYKIYLRDARVEQADAILLKMRALMQADGASVLPADYTNRVLTDMLLEMVSTTTSTPHTDRHAPRNGQHQLLAHASTHARAGARIHAHTRTHTTRAHAHR